MNPPTSASDGQQDRMQGSAASMVTNFRDAIVERGLPADATLADLIQHERGQMGMQVASAFMAEMYRAANRLEEAGDKHGAGAIRKAVSEGAPTDDPT